MDQDSQSEWCFPAGDVVRRLRRVIDMSQRELAKASKVARATITRIEAGQLDPRRFPAHLDTIVEPEPGEWWGDAFGLARPPETFTRDRRLRDERRAASQRDLYRGPFRRRRRHR